MEPSDDLDLKFIDFEIFKACSDWDRSRVRALPEGLKIMILKPQTIALAEGAELEGFPLDRQGEFVLRFKCSWLELMELKRKTGDALIHDCDYDVLEAELEIAKEFNPDTPPIEATNSAAWSAARRARRLAHQKLFGPVPNVAEMHEQLSQGQGRGPLKRDALVKALEAMWPRIDADLREASRNGLSCARDSKFGFWDESRALRWAEAKGRLTRRRGAALLSSKVHRST